MALFVSCAGARSSGRAGSEGSDPTLGLSLVHTLRGTGSPAGSAGPGSYRWAWLVCSPGPGARGRLSLTHRPRREGEFSNDARFCSYRRTPRASRAPEGMRWLVQKKFCHLEIYFWTFIHTRKGGREVEGGSRILSTP